MLIKPRNHWNNQGYFFRGKNSLNLVEAIGFHRTFVPETSRNKVVNPSTF